MSSKAIVTAVLTSLQSIQQSSSHALPTSTRTHDTPLRQLAGPSRQQAKNVLLTLHFLFPHELLPALDLIDRQLITNLHMSGGDGEHPSLANGVYYVQSSSTSTPADLSNSTSTTGRKSGRFRNALARPGTFYEVQLDSWNCSCPAFALSALRMMMRDANVASPQDVARNLYSRIDDTAQDSLKSAGKTGWEANRKFMPEWLFGGNLTKPDATIPVCKHILAVVLTKAAPVLFGDGVVEREVGKEELAAWTAGWGEH